MLWFKEDKVLQEIKKIRALQEIKQEEKIIFKEQLERQIVSYKLKLQNINDFDASLIQPLCDLKYKILDGLESCRKEGNPEKFELSNSWNLYMVSNSIEDLFKIIENTHAI